jgi:hypothetical protein
VEANDFPEGAVVFDYATNRHYVAFTPFMSDAAMWHCLTYESFEECKRILGSDNTLELRGPVKIYGNLFRSVEES